ncbi:MAG: 3-phosphoshikimate 1-carboxyvinyltransferase [Chloroflexi bacterium RBG_13_51_18]|nr:MAG: 3-phosphoshikimate 1-carboxyvinyltransferase [Chloroflexi bacterium RBG_13_51_18]
MRVTIGRSNITGAVIAPSSKSMTIRALVCAALSQGESEIINPLVSDDTNAAVNVLTKLGTIIRQEGDVWKITGGRFRVHTGDLDCGESATTLRFMTALCSLIPGRHRLVGGPSLSRRPVGTLVDALVKLGVKASAEKTGQPPVIVEGGPFKGGITDIAGNVSSQFISALLLISPFAPKAVSIKLTTPLTSKPYILMTLRCLKQFGIDVNRQGNMFVVVRQKYCPASVKIEGDWSSASYFLALGAMSEEGVVVQNLNTASLQGDRVIVDMLRNMGARIRISGSNVLIAHGRLRAIKADLSDCIDLLPTMAVLAAMARGTSELTGIQRARLKESNRVSAVREGLVKLGITVTEEDNRMKIVGINALISADDENVDETLDEAPTAAQFFAGASQESIAIRSHDDHRIAMAFAVIATVIGGVAVRDAECVTKTYPAFWQDFQKIGGEIQIDEQQSG